jgi:hypothetical protein
MVSLRIGLGREEPLAEVVGRAVGVRSMGTVPTKLRFLLTPARKYGVDDLWIARLAERYVKRLGYGNDSRQNGPSDWLVQLNKPTRGTANYKGGGGCRH